MAANHANIDRVGSPICSNFLKYSQYFLRKTINLKSVKKQLTSNKIFRLSFDYRYHRSDLFLGRKLNFTLNIRKQNAEREKINGSCSDKIRSVSFRITRQAKNLFPEDVSKGQ